MFKHLREFILLQAEKFGPKKESVFYTALLQWIWSEELLNDETIESINFENFNLNYLLELIIRDGAEAVIFFLLGTAFPVIEPQRLYFSKGLLD